MFKWPARRQMVNGLMVVLLGALLAHCAWNPKSYVVQSGDTLLLIAWRYNLTTEQLAEWNNLDNPNLIYPGQKLHLRAGRKQAVKKRASAPVREKKYDKSRDQQWGWPLQDAREIIERFEWNGKAGRKGISFAGQEGVPVLASRSGTVVYVGADIPGVGNMVVVQHDELYLSFYGHNERILVEEKDWVDQGEKIAIMGSSDTNRIKLYFEIRRDGKAVDPESLLADQSG